MTEAGRATCRDPSRTLDYHPMKKSPRRYRLLAAARRVADKARDVRWFVGEWAEGHLGCRGRRKPAHCVHGRWNLGFPL